jgi:aminoglycoside 3-N-acetyltransferase
VIAHSSMRTLGWVEGGATTVLAAILGILGPRGTLLLPTFNYIAPDPYYDPLLTPCLTGAVPEASRRFPNAIRSLHPTHSFVAIGRDAEGLTADHLATRALGVGSPIDRLARRDGKVLLIGVDQTANTTIHLGEEYAGTPKVSRFPGGVIAHVRLASGEVIEHPLDDSPSCSLAFNAVEGALRAHAEIGDGRIRECHLQLMSGSRVVERTVELLDRQPDLLLCRWSSCIPCTGARARLAAQGRTVSVPEIVQRAT